MQVRPLSRPPSLRLRSWFSEQVENKPRRESNIQYEMKTREIDARCPVCKEWLTIPETDLGVTGRCGNCQQMVQLIPRSSQAKFRRNLVAIIVTLLIIGSAIWLYNYRVKVTTRNIGGQELPDLSPR